MFEHSGPRLRAALRAWGTDDFDRSLKAEVEELGAGYLPLHNCTRQGGRVDDGDISVTVIHSRESGEALLVNVGVFFTELVGGCSCGDDPFTQPVYCMLLVTIDKQTASAGFGVIDEPE